MTQISVGILGLGRMGRLHARVFGELAPKFVLRGFADPAPVVPGDVPRLGSTRALIEACELLVVAAPASAHPALACEALAAGRALLVEKPLALTVHEARAITSAAAPGRVFVGHSERFNPVVRALFRSLRVGGEPALELTFERLVPASTDAVLLNLGVHDLDLVEHLTGARARVLEARGDHASARVVLAAGEAVATVTCARNGEPTRSIRVVTRDRIFSGDLLRTRLAIVDRRTGREQLVSLDRSEPLRAQAQSLFEALTGNGEAEIATAAAGVRAVELAERAAALCATEATRRVG